MKKIACFLFILLCVAYKVEATEVPTYYIIDTVACYGSKLIDGGIIENCRFCQEEKNGKIKKFKPTEVSEYQIGKGLHYVSQDIFLNNAYKRVFLEKREAGKYNLYQFRDRKTNIFFLQKDSGILVALPKRTKDGKSFKSQLREYTSDCNAVSSNVFAVDYTMNSLALLLERFNSRSSNPFPHTRFGVSVGSAFTKLLVPPKMWVPNLNNFDFRYVSSASLGLFMDQPLFPSDFSMHVSCNFTKEAFSYSQQVDGRNYDYVANISTLELPLLVRYTVPLASVYPFIEMGGLASWNFKRDDFFQEELINGQTINIIESYEPDLINQFYTGFSFGGGIEYPIFPKMSLFLECRYDYCLNRSTLSQFRLSKFNLTTGIAF